MPGRTPTLLTGWILWSTFCVLAGWTLSAFHRLNAGGYLIAAGVGAAVALGVRWKLSTLSSLAPRAGVVPARWRWRRFRRPLPFLYLLLAALALLGAVMYCPNNYDALSYREPRLLHWLAEGRWHWIHTPNYRANIAAAASEWVLAPLLLFTRSDRLFFVPNLISFLLLPGLLFSVFRLAGVRPRVAWFWMWLLPSGYCFAMQAGSIANDLPGAVYGLAAFHYALRARQTNVLAPAWLSLLSIGLLAGVKVSNLPLGLPWLVAFLPVVPRLRRRWLTSAAVMILTAFLSFLPTAVLNQRHTGHWGGDPENKSQVQLSNPIAGLVGNTLLMLTQGSLPPVLLNAHKVEDWIKAHLPQSVTALLKRDYPRFDFGLNELPQEEASGLGASLSLLAGASMLVACFAAARALRDGTWRRLWRMAACQLGAAAWVAFAVYLARMGSEATARLLTSYYPLLLLPLLVPAAHSTLVRRQAWHWLAWLTAACALLAVVLTPSRPLFPALTIFARLARAYPSVGTWTRAERVYTIYRHRNDALAALRRYLPANQRDVGMTLSEDDLELSLWRPLGSRRVRYVSEAELFSPEHAGLDWILVRLDPIILKFPDPKRLAASVLPAGGEIVGTERLSVKASDAPQEWVVVHFVRR